MGGAERMSQQRLRGDSYGPLGVDGRWVKIESGGTLGGHHIYTGQQGHVAGSHGERNAGGKPSGN